MVTVPSEAIHQQEKDQFIKLFQQDRIDRFEDRLAVLEVFLRTEHHVTAAELAERMHRKGYPFDQDFVLDTIRLMCRYGFAHQNRFNNGQVRYEHRHLGQHHDHMVCTKCKRIIEFENQAIEQLQVKVASEYGFHMLQHRMELYGICGDCLGRRQQLWLDHARQGERLQIVEFAGGARGRMRLLTMGLRIGDELEVIASPGKGQLVVAADYKRIVLGKGMAQKIRVRPLSGNFTENADGKGERR